MLLVKMLITYDPEDCKLVGDFALATLPETRPETSCLDIVNFFQEGKSHMVLVSEYPGENHGALGVVTLEDVIEELIGEEIIDESDVYIDVHKAIRRIAPAPKARIPKGHFISDTEYHRAVAPEDTLIDISENRSLMNNGSERTDSHTVDPDLRLLNRASTTLSDYGSSPKATFLKRSTSNNGDDLIPIRGNVAEMREHLKHLGPWNLAARPKSTRYSAVKIKPGGQASDSCAEAGGRNRQVSLPDDTLFHRHATPSNIGVALLGSDFLDVRGRVQEPKQGYGSMDRTHPLRASMNQD